MEGKQTIHFDFNNMMADTIGPEHGITEQELKNLAPIASRYANDLKEERASGKLQFQELPYQKNITAEIIKTANSLKGKFKNLVVVGIGGSALGNIAINAALNHPLHNILTDQERKSFPRVFVLDNIDPDRFSGLIDIVKPEETLFNFITKSGTTVETMAQFLIIVKRLRDRLGKDYKEHIITTTDSEKGTLREITRREGFQSFVIPAGVGGRYSVLTPVGLFSAAMSGVDIAALLDGAALMDEVCKSDNLWKNPALMGAVLYFLSHTKKGKNILVMMPYSNALSGVADWFCQLWAESLGKKFSLNKEVVHAGSTPVRAVGVVDQHSQLQLYMEGPYDKVITFLAIKRFNEDVSIAEGNDVESDLIYLKGHSLNNVMKAEFEGTRLALTEQQRSNGTVTLDELSAFTLGQLFYLLELQTAYAGKFYNVDAFDQPGVEAGKINAFAMLGKKGFEQRKKEIDTHLQGAQKKYCI
ncbi:MAG TPA: glucose-6-phosphate isomerase [Candidatus Wunengus sp. YC60]|uniref:glucose-6-phosphate isomerase n=1 Tax=Candidatus Wunengus sp. YC60 TaxID=3367697 RepID=UPI00402620DB